MHRFSLPSRRVNNDKIDTYQQACSPLSPSSVTGRVVTSEEAVRMILDDDEQWYKLRLAVRRSDARTNMRLSFCLDELLQERSAEITVRREMQEDDSLSSFSSFRSDDSNSFRKLSSSSSSPVSSRTEMQECDSPSSFSTLRSVDSNSFRKSSLSPVSNRALQSNARKLQSVNLQSLDAL